MSATFVATYCDADVLIPSTDDGDRISHRFFRFLFFRFSLFDRGRSTCSHRRGSRSFIHSFIDLVIRFVRGIFFVFKAAGIEGCAHRRCHHNSVELGDCGVPMVAVVFVGAATRRGERREEKRRENKVKCGPGEVVVEVS